MTVGDRHDGENVSASGGPPHRPPTPSRDLAVVTGASGFIGSHVTDALLRDGVKVVGIDRRDVDRDPTAANNLADAQHTGGFEFVSADLADTEPGRLRELVSSAAVVYHIAGVFGVRNSWGAGFDHHLDCNIKATQRILEACVAAQVPRVVISSSSSVYGRWRGRASAESDLTAPISPYAASKVAIESLGCTYAALPDNELSVVALRYFTVYGPRQRPDMMVSRVLQAAATGVPVTLFGDGRQRRDFTYVDDVVHATVAASRVPAAFELINVGGGNPTAVNHLIDVAAEIGGSKVPLRRAEPQHGDVDVTHADLTKAERLLGYKPGIDLTNGMLRQWQWLTGSPRPQP